MSVQPGDGITILHHPRNTARAIAYRFSLYEAA
jgi:hypothetical protein